MSGFLFGLAVGFICGGLIVGCVVGTAMALRRDPLGTNRRLFTSESENGALRKALARAAVDHGFSTADYVSDGGDL